MKIINKNTPERLEKKRIELKESGIKVELQPSTIHLKKEKAISIEWKLEWFENEGSRNGGS